MVSNFKNKMFDLKSTKIPDLNKIDNFFMMLSINYCICCKTGAIRNPLIEIPVKKLRKEIKQELKGVYIL